MNRPEVLPDPAGVERVAVIGAGLIGAGWAALFLLRGLKVVVWDPAPGFDKQLITQLERIFSRLHVEAPQQASCFDSLSFANSAEAAVSDAQFVQENGPEKLQLKRSILIALSQATQASTIIASSSSGLPMSELQQGCRNPERMVIGHPFNPVYLIPLVEIVAGRETAAETVDWVEAFYRRLGKVPVVCTSENIGFIANRLQESLFREALHMIDKGEATVSQIDDVVRYGPGLRWAFMGPLLSSHLTGGEGGLRGFFERFGDSVSGPYSRLAAPELTDALVESVIKQSDSAFGNLSVEQLEQWRDDCLRQLLALSVDHGAGYSGRRSAHDPVAES